MFKATDIPMTQDEPFRSKADRECERALEAKYQELGNDAVVAALRQRQAALSDSNHHRTTRGAANPG